MNIKFPTISIFSSSICHEMMGQDAMILVFWMLSFKPAFSLHNFPLPLYLDLILQDVQTGSFSSHFDISQKVFTVE